MADAEDKTVVRSEDQVEGKAEGKADGEAEGKAKAESSSGSKKMIMFGLVGVGAIVMGVVLAIFVLKPMLSDNSDSEGHDKPAVHKKKESKGHGEPATSTFFAVKDIVVNPAGTGGTRFLSVSFAFQVDSPEMAELLESKETIVRDVLITILSAKTVAQLTDPKQKEIIRYQIKKRVSQLLEEEELMAVYYTDFVLQ